MQEVTCLFGSRQSLNQRRGAHRTVASHWMGPQTRAAVFQRPVSITAVALTERMLFFLRSGAAFSAFFTAVFCLACKVDVSRFKAGA